MIRFAFTIATCIVLASCAHPPGDGTAASVTIKGSDTMLPLARSWAESFMRERPDVVVRVDGGGSEGGFKALIGGDVDICAASRPMSGVETSALMKKYSSVGFSVLSARDAVCLYTHPENTVHSLSVDQIRDMFTGKLTNWKDVGGDDAPIRLFQRNDGSGTRRFFQDHVLRGAPVSGTAMVFPTTAGIVEEIARDPHAIGYGGTGYTKGIKPLRVDDLEASAENVRSGRYPIARYLYLYTVRPPTGGAKEFIDWVLSPEGQHVVETQGFIPLYESASVY